MLAILSALLPASSPYWAGAAALAALIYTAIIDARSGRVPPYPLFVAGIIVVVGWLLVDPSLVAPHVLAAFAGYAAIWSLNMVWRMLYKHDALGMGDASWTCVAVLAYGWQLAVAAWGGGAVLALLFLALRHAIGKPARHVYFAPFLCIALIAAQLLRQF